ncbi:Hypothetical predicted protein [Mytilus galloprovincialis]|uniref:Uncharacterized protein n=1 Tax=Mytilus galloprovincialis TaxID=29158 RepID=A0A8B6DVE3_MYTGA|nr:Hypothetical predicted protein [Mytilus galloprovincialis]
MKKRVRLRDYNIHFKQMKFKLIIRTDNSQSHHRSTWLKEEDETIRSLACFSCHSESDRSRCLTHQVECRDGLEECFFDKTTLQNSAVVYTAGCRSKAVCDLLGNAVGKRDDISRSRRTSVVCAQCCNTAPKNRIPCNAQLCDDRLTCLSCHSVSDISKCLTHHTVCQGPDEECYLDKTILPNLSTAYNAGCRSKTVCSLLSGAVGKRNVDIQLQRLKKASISCSECCNTQPDRSGVPCNRNLCKLGTSAYETCGVCDHVSSPGACSVHQVCPPNEVCTVNSIFTGGVLKYELGCELKTVCDATLKIYKGSHGKRAGHGDLVLCSACCSGKNCNTKGDCSTLIRNQPCFNTTICG